MATCTPSSETPSSESHLQTFKCLAGVIQQACRSRHHQLVQRFQEALWRKAFPSISPGPNASPWSDTRMVAWEVLCQLCHTGAPVGAQAIDFHSRPH